MSLRPIRLLPSFRERIWGVARTEPWFPSSGSRIGEAWLTGDDNQTELGPTLGELIRTHGAELMGSSWRGGPFPILTKFIFTSERLSIQVHPDDRYAAEHEGSCGKTEMWVVLAAEPGAAVAVGLEEPVGRESLRQAAITGEIEKLVRWVPVEVGDVILVPAGTIHAIGAGLTVCEIQQNSDITYRLYDYGRPRELHLDRGIAVSSLERHPGPFRPTGMGPGLRLLARCQYFAAEEIEVAAPIAWTPDPRRVQILITLEGSGELDSRPLERSQAWLVPACAAPFTIQPRGNLRLLKTYVPNHLALVD